MAVQATLANMPPVHIHPEVSMPYSDSNMLLSGVLSPQQLLVEWGNDRGKLDS
jgi:hypothetical protein